MQKTEFSKIKPLYVGVEGPGGGGKTTTIEYLSIIFKELTGREVVCTREPGGTPKAEKIREEIFSLKATPNSNGLTIVEMFNDARVLTIKDVVKPNLNVGRHVITDRYAASTRAYECAGMGVDWDDARRIHLDKIGNFGPDVTYYLSVKMEEGLKRKSRQKHNDSFDEEKRSFHKKVWAEYERIYEENHDPKNIDPIFGLWILIDTNVSRKQVRRQLLQKTREYLALC